MLAVAATGVVGMEGKQGELTEVYARRLSGLGQIGMLFHIGSRYDQ